MFSWRRFCWITYTRAMPIIAPGNRSSQHEFHQVLEQVVTQDTDWLDLGCGHQIFPDDIPDDLQYQLARRCGQLVGIDSDSSSLSKNEMIKHKILGDAHQLPLADESFDLVTSNMVVEHIDDPERFLSEVYRVLKRGGRFLFLTPNRRSYAILLSKITPHWAKDYVMRVIDSRDKDDIYPTRYRMNDRKSIERLTSIHGFSDLSVECLETWPITTRLGPLLLIPELLLLRLLRMKPLAGFRTNLIVDLRK